MKTLTELQLEIELGMMVYPSTNHEVFVFLADGWYVFARSETPAECESGVSHGERMLIGGDFDADGGFHGGGVIFDDCYKTLDTLLADWSMIASQAVWSTAKTPERLNYEQQRYQDYQKKHDEWKLQSHQDMMRGRIEGVFPYNLFKDPLFED